MTKAKGWTLSEVVRALRLSMRLRIPVCGSKTLRFSTSHGAEVPFHFYHSTKEDLARAKD